MTPKARSCELRLCTAPGSFLLFVGVLLWVDEIRFAPIGIDETLEILGYATYQLVQDLVHLLRQQVFPKGNVTS